MTCFHYIFVILLNMLLNKTCTLWTFKQKAYTGEDYHAVPCTGHTFLEKFSQYLYTVCTATKRPVHGQCCHNTTCTQHSAFITLPAVL